MTGVVTTKDPGPPPKNDWGGKGDGNWRWLSKLYLNANQLTFAKGISAVLDLLGAVRGDLLYRGASVWSALAPGTSGLFLQTKGAGNDPVWAAAITQAYTTVEEEGAALTQRSVLNFIGTNITAADNSGATRTDVTLSDDWVQNPIIAAAFTVPSGFQSLFFKNLSITGTNNLTLVGDLGVM